MKVLIASVGQRLESLVAKRFEHASWYLLVDVETHAMEVLPHRTPQDRHAALEEAGKQGASVVVAGKFGESSLKLLRTHGMRAALLHGIAAHEAIEKIRASAVPLLQPEGLAQEKTPAVATLLRPIPKQRGPRVPLSASPYNSDSPRGHHHLQQYAGRGH
jgi:predicted Fe-Mo cluster-binding NifX family protein